MAQSKFKTGDRVRWNGDTYNPGDCGIVQDDSSGAYVWVLWDSDGDIKQIDEKELEYESTSNRGVEFTVENCIDFLISQGYSVTISK